MKHTLALLVILLLDSFMPLYGGNATKPNLLIILSDDQGYGDVSA